jgi:ParB-like chromosome segregation protein Spo0J
MAITQALSHSALSSTFLTVDIEAIAQHGVQAIFRTRPVAMTHTILNYMERKERSILLLLDGTRTLQDVARLTHRSELEIAHMLVYLLRRGLIEFLGSAQNTCYCT